MNRLPIEIGMMFSLTGSYAAVGEAMHAGATLAVEEVNADPAFDFALDARTIDVGGCTARYVEVARAFLETGSIRHIVGCYTSSSRKEVLPIFEKRDALLWYPSHYEGFETSENVIYTGAAPNQHVVPLTRHLLASGFRRAFLVGSNYIWAWENNRIMREALTAAKGGVLGERYFPIGERDLGEVIGQILDLQPDFVFNTLIGESAYAFYRRFRAAAAARGLDQPAALPVASCSLAEPELARIGEGCDGHLSSSVYFSTIATPENVAFRRSWMQRFPSLGDTSADAEASYIAVHLLARAIRAAGSGAMDAVRAAVGGLTFAAPQGEVHVNPENRHLQMRPLIGRSRHDGTFEIIYGNAAPVQPDPYLVWDIGPSAETAREQLRIVS